MIAAARASALGRIAAAAVAVLFVVIAVATVGAAGLTQSAGVCRPDPAVPAGLPDGAQQFASLYPAAASRYRLGARGPAILASIHQTESGFGTNIGPSTAGAIGQMQFLPSSWRIYGVDADGDGVRDPYDAADAIFAAARLLRAAGAPTDWHGAIFAYNHSESYVQQILTGAQQLGAIGDLTTPSPADCGVGAPASGSAELDRAVRIYEPARDQLVPARFVAPGHGPIKIDARIWPDVQWVLVTYGLVLTAGKETGHRSHGDGSAIDAVPASGSASITEWQNTAGRLATDLGWTPDCAAAGVRPACDLVPAIEFVGYNGYPGHGDPAHTSGAHIHVSWVSSTHGTPYLTTPQWLLAFPVSSVTADASSDPMALVVGDSLTVGDAPYLRRRLGAQVAIDAQAGRPSWDGLEVLHQRLASVETIVVFDLGTNDDPSDPGQLADDLAAARRLTGSRCLVVSTVNRPGDSALNRVIARFASTTPRVELVDWHRVAHERDALGADGIHSTPEGYRIRADAEIDGMLRC
jgi:hypothetical protein